MSRSVGKQAGAKVSKKTDLSIAHELAEDEDSGFDMAGYLPDRTMATARDMIVDELV